MSLLAFTSDATDMSQAYAGQHETSLVLLSLLIAVLAAYTSFSHRSLIQHAAGVWSRWLWLSSGAVAMGLGVWAMHFTGMMSVQLPVTVNYQLDLTLISVVPAIAAAYVSLHVVAAPVTRVKSILSGGLLMGAGIGSMHYIGMAAMQMQAERLYQPVMFAVSLLLAVGLATLALGIRPLLKNKLTNKTLLELTSSTVMGVAIAGMHYVAMHATVFLPLRQKQQQADFAISTQMLGTVAVVVAVAILLVAMIAVIMRQRIRVAERSSDAAQEQARLIASRLHRIASRVPGLVYEFHLSHDGHFTFPYASDAIYPLFRITPQQAKVDAMPMMTVVHPDDRDALLQSIYRSAQLLLPWQHEYRVISEQGAVRWLLGNAVPERDSDGVSWCGFTTDISQRKEADEKMHQLAYYDALTGLFNRRKIQHSLQALCSEFGESSPSSAVILLDVDNFKRINDTQGHKAGDEMLRQVAARLLQFVPPGSICGRLSSDEFVIVVTDLPLQLRLASRQLEQFTQQLRQQLQQPYSISGHHYSSSFSLGYSIFNDVALSADDLLKQADIAVSHAKAAGGNCQFMFAPKMKQQMQQRFALENALASATTQGELSLHYQPQVTDTADVIGVEALLRWHNPTLGRVAPAEFIPLAEETGLIEEIGLWVLQQACQQLARWHSDPLLAGITMSVNISARQFYLPEFVDIVQQCISDYDFNPRCLMLELTESLVLADLDDAVAKMQHIKQLGVKFSMDDFGTGFSSLSYLSRLPFDEVKIDQYFVRSCTSGQLRDWVIINAIIGIAGTFGMKLIAEGVETAAQQQLLQQSGCHCYQGYLFARPAPAGQTELWIKQYTGQAKNS